MGFTARRGRVINGKGEQVCGDGRFGLGGEHKCNTQMMCHRKGRALSVTCSLLNAGLLTSGGL